MRTLQVISCAYRATVEEQDDTIVWLTRALRAAGAELGVLLTGNAVSYAASGRRAPSLTIHEWHQTQPADVSADLQALADQGVLIYAIEEDLEERGMLGELQLLKGTQVIPRQGLATLFKQYPRIWCW